MTGLGTGMYPSSYPTSDQNPYPSISMDNSAFYPSLVSNRLNRLDPSHLLSEFTIKVTG